MSYWVTVDGIDVDIEYPSLFLTHWWSHETNNGGLRYEVAVTLMEGFIVWVIGPYPAGSFPDVKIFRDVMKYELDDD